MPPKGLTGLWPRTLTSVTGVEPSTEEIQYELNKWLPCTDELYWPTKQGLTAIVQIDGYVYTQSDCPYGWNVLCHGDAKIMYISLNDE